MSEQKTNPIELSSDDMEGVQGGCPNRRRGLVNHDTDLVNHDTDFVNHDTDRSPVNQLIIPSHG